MRKFPAYLEMFNKARLIFTKKAIEFNIAKKMLETSLKKYILKEELCIWFKQYMKDFLHEDKYHLNLRQL